MVLASLIIDKSTFPSFPNADGDGNVNVCVGADDNGDNNAEDGVCNSIASLIIDKSTFPTFPNADGGADADADGNGNGNGNGNGIVNVDVDVCVRFGADDKGDDDGDAGDGVSNSVSSANEQFIATFLNLSRERGVSDRTESTDEVSSLLMRSMMSNSC
jgi:hypothetical protein